jgi:hypothetical protein
MRASLDELAQAMALRVSKQTLYADALLALSGWLDAASSEVHALRHATRRMPPTGALCARERWQPRAGGAPMSQARSNFLRTWSATRGQPRASVRAAAG